MLNATNTTGLNIVVTAATSSLGREVVRKLAARGHKVTGFTQGSEGAAKVREDGGLPAYPDLFRAGEIKSALHMAQADVVIHTAPMAGNVFPYRELPWEDHVRLLTDGTTALLDAVSESSVKFIVYFSSTSVYGDTHGEWVDENHNLHESRELSAVHQAEERVLHHPIPAAVLRAGINYGPEDEGLKTLSEAIFRGRGFYLGDEHAYQNWIHVSDLASAAVLAAEQQPADQIFNIVDDNPVSAAEFAGYLATGMGLPAPKNTITTPLFLRRLQVQPIQETLLTASCRARNEKAKQALGWTPRHADYRSGIEQTLLAWRAATATK